MKRWNPAFLCLVVSVGVVVFWTIYVALWDGQHAELSCLGVEQRL